MAKNIADGDIIWTQRKRNWCRTPFTFTTYTLTADELATQSGLLHQSFDTVKLFRIVDITISRTLLQRIFGLSTILIDAMDQSTGGKIVLKNIIDSFAVRKELQHAVDAAPGKAERSVRPGRRLLRRPGRIRPRRGRIPGFPGQMIAAAHPVTGNGNGCAG